MDLSIVFSTNPDWKPEEEPEVETLAPNKQNLKLRMERKGRGGKTATIVAGFVGSDNDLEALAKDLKKSCGVGGSVKDGEIIIQGDKLSQVRDVLKSKGYQVKG